MMGIEDKTLLCFCHWGKINKVLPDGSISYGGGITDQVIAKTGIKYNDFVNAVFDRLGIDPSDKMLHFTVKFDRSELIRLRDQKGVDTLLQFNDGYAHIYASSLEKEPYSRSPSGGMKNVEHIIVSDTEPDTTPVCDDQNDNECGVLSKAAIGKLPPHPVNQEPFVRQNNIPNDFISQFSNLNHHQYKRPTSSAIQETFWTKCPTCKIRYKYYSNYVNRALRCQKCSMPFIAYDLGSQGAACRPNQSQPGGQDMPFKSNKPFEQRELPNQGTSKMTAVSAGFPPTQTGPRQGPEISRGKTAPVFEDTRTKQKDEKQTISMKEGAAMPKVYCRKRFRKQTVELSESHDTSIGVETEDVEIENGNNPPAGQGTRLDGYDAGRLSQHWQHVSNNEGVRVDNNDSAIPLKKARSNHVVVTRSCNNFAERLNKNGVGLLEGDVKKNNSKIGTVNKHIPVPNAEFSDFDIHTAENCFAVNQIWACYDTADVMPRFYAIIRKVSGPEFKIKLSWLKAYPENQREVAWVRANLPVASGKFRRGASQYTSDRFIFSHQVDCKMNKRGLYVVYPKKGETWAIFKDWDIHWSSNPKIHTKYKYEIVEILSDYVDDIGVRVGYLDKVTGFVSLFQRRKITEAGTFLGIPFFVKPNELYKFSHRIPSFKMTGTEGEGVPARSFELDLASC